MLTASVVSAGLLAVPGVARAEEPAADSTAPRERVLMAWQVGGPEVRAAAEQALLGGDADITAFLDTQWEELQTIDERLAVSRMIGGGGSATRTAGQQALDSSDPDAVRAFLSAGWEDAAALDQRVKVSQMIAVGGPRLRAAGEQALNTGSPEALETFIGTGWEAPYLLDQRVRITQALASGGPEVKRLAQRALQTATHDAYDRFLESEWAIGAARDQETSAIADLTATAEQARDEASEQTQIAKDESAKAAAGAESARKAALAAATAVDRAGNNAAKAAAAARQAADAASNAAKAAREAISAAQAANEAARVAASAAARAASAAALTQKATTRAYRAAADAATNATKAEAARDAAKAARDAARVATRAADAAAQVGIAAKEAENAARAAGAASGLAIEALGHAENAAALAREVGVNTQQAEAAASRARANANQATRAANNSARFAGQAATAADKARDAARRAVSDALAAADAADEAAAHAGEAAEAAARSTAAANAATAAANDAVAAVEEAQAVYDAAREADAERLAVALEEGRLAAQEASAALLRYREKAAADTQEAARRSVEVNELVAVVRNPATPRADAIVAARKVALALTSSPGPWTRDAAMDALASADDVALDFVRHSMDDAAAQDDRVNVESLAATGSEPMTRAAEAALAGSDADVAEFLANQDYPERASEERVAVAAVLAQANETGDTVLARRAQEVLDIGTVAALRQFLTVEQFDAAAIGDRVKAAQILSDPDSGPELKATAQIAIENTPAALRQFLDEGQHTARQNDAEAAAHEASVLALLAQATAAATTAVQQAQEAQAIAATARGKAAEAADWAERAEDSAAAAAGHANRAISSAENAQASAERAATSARNAAAAAQRARAAAGKAGRSAAWARDSYDRANDYAADALRDARKARDASLRAGDAAETAMAYYRQTVDAAIAQAESDMAAENAAQALKCQAEYLPGSEQWKNCRYHVTDSDSIKLGKALLNAEVCQKMAAPGSVYHTNCLYDTFNPNFATNRQLDIAAAFVAEMQAFTYALAGVTAFVVTMLACNAVCGAVLGMLGGAEVLMGIGGMVDLWLSTQLVNVAAGATVSTKAMSSLRMLSGIRVPATFQRITVSSEAEQALLGRLANSLEQCIRRPTSRVAAANVELDPCQLVLGIGNTKPVSLAQWSVLRGWNHYTGLKWRDPRDPWAWRGAVQSDILSREVTLHIRTDGFDGGDEALDRFLQAAFNGVYRKEMKYVVYGTEEEMSWIARAAYLDQRDWNSSSIKFYRGDEEMSFPAEPDWWNLVQNTDETKGVTKRMWQRFLDLERYFQENHIG